MPFPEAGQNAFHLEAVATAFAKAVVTAWKRESAVVAGSEVAPLPDFPRAGRVLAYLS